MKRLTLAASTALLIAVPAFAAPLGNGFTYQGELKLSGSSVNVATDFQFSLWDGPGAGCPTVGGTQLGATQTVANQTVTDGRFTVILNAAGEFGPNAFDGNARWLQIAVRSPGGGGAYTTLCPRQPITGSPYALKVPGIDGHSLDAADGSPLNALFVDNGGNVGIGTTTPTSLLQVNGTATVTGFQMLAGAGAGKVLTSDAGGSATWQPGGGGSLTLPFAGAMSGTGSAFMATNNGGGIGVHGVSLGGRSVFGREFGSGNNGYLGGSSGASGTHAASGNTGSLGTNSYGVVGQHGSTNDFGGIGALGFGAFGMHWASGNTGYLGTSVAGVDGVSSTGHRGYLGHSVAGVHGVSSTGHAGYLGHTLVAVYGQHATSGSYGGIGDVQIGAYGVNGSGSVGYLGAKVGPFAVDCGVYGNSVVAGVGVFGESNGISAIGVWGRGDYWAGYFSGDVNITGTVFGPQTLRIDHPLDPENKYLQQSSVVSDEMKSVYDGVVTLDGSGEAWVELPNWFESLNRAIRYQLTCIGEFAPVYVAQKVEGNRFRIGGGKPGMEISWLVTGVRQDALAKAKPLSVEVEKGSSERGRYLHPEAFGLPETRGVDYEKMRATQSVAPPKQAVRLDPPPKPPAPELAADPRVEK